TFNHGKGYVLGHQWTNIVLILGDMLIPLRPIPFYSKRYCQAHDLAYHSEHERVVAYLRTLDLEDSVGSYDRREVLVLADSGYDNKKIEKAIADKGWNFITRLLCFAIPGVYMILLDPILPSCKKGSTSDAASYCGSRSRGDGPRGHLSGSL